MLRLVRETAMAIERSIGLIDESRDLIERSGGRRLRKTGARSPGRR